MLTYLQPTAIKHRKYECTIKIIDTKMLVKFKKVDPNEPLINLDHHHKCIFPQYFSQYCISSTFMVIWS